MSYRNLLLIVVALGCNAYAKPKPVAQPAKPSRVSSVIDDGYYRASECVKYLDQFETKSRSELIDAAKFGIIGDTTEYLRKRPSLLSDIEIEFTKRDLQFNPELKRVRDTLNDSGSELPPYFGDARTRENAKTSNQVITAAFNNKDKNLVGAAKNYLVCLSVGTANESGIAASAGRLYGDYVADRPTKGDVGYFSITTFSSHVSKSIETGNRFENPKQWEGSRFFTVDTSFKNNDTESRLPNAGSLIINYHGKEYVYDSVEPIMAEGYNIWFRTINPLVAMRTKLVYRIPNEIEGEVYWRPGRNPTDQKLWVGYVDAAK